VIKIICFWTKEDLIYSLTATKCGVPVYDGKSYLSMLEKLLPAHGGDHGCNWIFPSTTGSEKPRDLYRCMKPCPPIVQNNWEHLKRGRIELRDKLFWFP